MGADQAADDNGPYPAGWRRKGAEALFLPACSAVGFSRGQSLDVSVVTVGDTGDDAGGGKGGEASLSHARAESSLAGSAGKTSTRKKLATTLGWSQRRGGHGKTRGSGAFPRRPGLVISRGTYHLPSQSNDSRKGRTYAARWGLEQGSVVTSGSLIFSVPLCIRYSQWPRATRAGHAFSSVSVRVPQVCYCGVGDGGDHHTPARPVLRHRSPNGIAVPGTC